jgi:Tfp pilus assembly PilM family ATPase
MLPEDEDDSVLILNLGYSKSYAAFLRGNTFGTARSIFGAGLQDLQEQLSGPLGISADRCGELLIGSDVKESDLDESKIKAALDFIFEEIAMKVDTALRYFSSVDNYMKPSKIVVTGGGSNITGLVSFLADRLSMDTVKLNPFKAIEMDPTRFFVKDADKDSGIYTVALGLALRRF